MLFAVLHLASCHLAMSNKLLLSLMITHLSGVCDASSGQRRAYTALGIESPF